MSRLEERKFKPTSRFTVEKAMAPHSSTLAWKIPWMEEPGGLQSMGSLTVGHHWATSLSLFTFTNKDLLYSTGNSAARNVAAWMEGEYGYTYMYGWAPLLPTLNNHNIVNWLYSNIKYKVKKLKKLKNQTKVMLGFFALWNLKIQDSLANCTV